MRFVWFRGAPELVCLCLLSIIQSGTRLQDGGLGTLVAGPCWCVLLFSVRRWCVSFRCPWDGLLVSGFSTLSEHRSVNWEQRAWRRTELSSQDGTLKLGRDVRRRTGRSSKDGLINRGHGALLKMVLLTENAAHDAGQNCQLRTERSTEGRAFNGWLVTRWKMERSSQDSFAWRSSLYGASWRSVLFAVLCC